jgi:ABC-type multidrug transport system fused ATPase/permease subunit
MRRLRDILSFARALLADPRILIVVMDTGRIVEQGTHEALMARRGRYFDLATARWRAEAA